MNAPKKHVIHASAGKLTLTEYPATITVTPAKIIEAVEKSELSLTEKTILITIVTNITNTGIQDVKELLSLAYKSLIDNPELFNKLIEIIKQSC